MSGPQALRAHERMLLALLAAATPACDRDALLGDLLEDHAECGGLAREALRALPPVLALRLQRAGGVRAAAFAIGAGALAATAVMLALTALWTFVLFHVPLRAAGALPPAWWAIGVVPALLAGVLAGRLSWRLAVRLLGGRA